MKEGEATCQVNQQLVKGTLRFTNFLGPHCALVRSTVITKRRKVALAVARAKLKSTCKLNYTITEAATKV